MLLCKSQIKVSVANTELFSLPDYVYLLQVPEHTSVLLEQTPVLFHHQSLCPVGSLLGSIHPQDSLSVSGVWNEAYGALQGVYTPGWLQGTLSLNWERRQDWNIILSKYQVKISTIKGDHRNTRLLLQCLL